MREGFPTVAQPAFFLNGLTYLPIYERPTLKYCWIDPANKRYTTRELVDAGAQMVMMQLWERVWLTDLVKIKDSTTSGEIKREYQKAFGII